MTHLYDYIGLCLALLWAVFRILELFLAPRAALIWAGIGLAAALLCDVWLQAEVAVLLIAVFAPFGTILPALALQNIARRQGLRMPTFGAGQQALILVLYVAFLCAALGVFSFDPYRFGYDPVLGSAMALAGCAYAVWSRFYFVACAFLLGQLAWTFDVGSSNYFDHITHVILVPVILISLLKLGLQTMRGGKRQSTS